MSDSVVTESIVNTANPAPGSARNPMYAGGSDLRMLAQVEKWMAVIREINREQQEPRFDIPTRGEPAMNSVSATVGTPHEIKIDKSHRVLNPPASGGGYIGYVAFVVGLLATACGVAWFILYESALPFGLTSVSSLTGNRDLVPKAISSGLEQSSNSPAAPDARHSNERSYSDTRCDSSRDCGSTAKPERLLRLHKVGKHGSAISTRKERFNRGHGERGADSDKTHSHAGDKANNY
jgi:hypothetical protein